MKALQRYEKKNKQLIVDKFSIVQAQKYLNAYLSLAGIVLIKTIECIFSNYYYLRLASIQRNH